MTREERYFSRDEADRLVPFLALLTSRAREELEFIWSRLGGASSDEEIHAAYGRMNAIRETWYREVRELGGRPVRLWEVVFPSGDGFDWSWRSGERAIGFVARGRIGTWFLRYPLPAPSSAL